MQSVDIEELIRKVIGAAINVHRELGPGFLESVYEEALAVESKRQGIRFQRPKVVPILYLGRQVGEHRWDFLVEDCLIVDNKAVSELDPVFFVIIRSYLKATGKREAVLFNFAAMPLTIKRVGPEDISRSRATSRAEIAL